jgi:hypothetical protein
MLHTQRRNIRGEQSRIFTIKSIASRKRKIVGPLLISLNEREWQKATKGIKLTKLKEPSSKLSFDFIRIFGGGGLIVPQLYQKNMYLVIDPCTGTIYYGAQEPGIDPGAIKIINPKCFPLINLKTGQIECFGHCGQLANGTCQRLWWKRPYGYRAMCACSKI